MLEAITGIPSYFLFRRLGRPRRLPANLTISVTFSCNSRCRTCRVYERPANDLSAAEWERIFAGIGPRLFWCTVSGGEPFLREDLGRIVRALVDRCRPRIVNLATNGLLGERITAVVGDLARRSPRTRFVVNLSLDEIGQRHDELRGVPGNYRKALQTFAALRGLGLRNLSVGLHTVISTWNVERLPQIADELIGLGPDSYVAEVAEEREELRTVGLGITPSPEAFASAAAQLAGRLRASRFPGLGRLTRALRLEYYRLAAAVLRERRQVIPCYAGFASAQIAADGQVWMCCTQAEPVGDLRAEGYDFRRIWRSPRAAAARRAICAGECHCPLANACYTSMLQHPGSMLRVAGNLLRGNRRVAC